MTAQLSDGVLYRGRRNRSLKYRLLLQTFIDCSSTLGIIYETRINMADSTFEGYVRDGQIRLEGDIRLPENTKVIVVVPSIAGERIAHIMSPRLVKEPGARPLRFEISKEPTGDSTV
jgi:hypothetical protein